MFFLPYLFCQNVYQYNYVLFISLLNVTPLLSLVALSVSFTVPGIFVVFTQASS